MTEYWKDIQDYEGLYQISDCGQVHRLRGHQCKKQHILKPRLNNRGYLFVELWKNNQRKICVIHTLVLNSFIGHKPEKMECRHLDSNCQNNHLSNIKWGTRSENQQDSIRHGTFFRPNNQGSKHGMAKLNNAKVKKIKYLITSGASCIQIAKQFNVHPNTIYSIKSGQNWIHIEWPT